MKTKRRIKIEWLPHPTQNDVGDINMLLPQQADKPHLLTLRELKRVVNQECIRMAVARTSVGGRDAIVGMASLVLYWVPTGLIAFIEEFTVDEHFRGHGIGSQLIQKLIQTARAVRAKHISTYTNPKRIAANAVYQKFGFFQKETNFYRINLFLPKPSRAKKIQKILARRKKMFNI
ncbi:MAG: streptothricin acetyltransferase [Parcubacteria group bacterium Gr01-1014_33]|nr:MAG: streptothricin acetyltransferase [Parcubacteria group bacterium Gr01-1014_33]